MRGEVTRVRFEALSAVETPQAVDEMPFRLSELERDCPGVGRDTVRKVLRESRDRGKLVAEGTGAGARWRPIDAP